MSSAGSCVCSSLHTGLNVVTALQILQAPGPRLQHVRPHRLLLHPPGLVQAGQEARGGAGEGQARGGAEGAGGEGEREGEGERAGEGTGAGEGGRESRRT